MSCHAMHPMQDLFLESFSQVLFIFGKFFTSTIILYVLLFAQRVLFFFAKSGCYNGRPCPKLGEVSFHGLRRNCPWAQNFRERDQGG
jgi:hypothetical protein